MSRVLALLRTAWRALDLDLRDAEFYGGLILIAFGASRLAIVGGILVAHAWTAPLLLRRP